MSKLHYIECLSVRKLIALRRIKIFIKFKRILQGLIITYISFALRSSQLILKGITLEEANALHKKLTNMISVFFCDDAFCRVHGSYEVMPAVDFVVTLLVTTSCQISKCRCMNNTPYIVSEFKEDNHP